MICRASSTGVSRSTVMGFAVMRSRIFMIVSSPLVALLRRGRRRRGRTAIVHPGTMLLHHRAHLLHRASHLARPAVHAAHALHPLHALHLLLHLPHLLLH